MRSRCLIHINPRKFMSIPCVCLLVLITILLYQLEHFFGQSHFPVAPMPNTMQPNPDIPATSARIPESTSEDEELAVAISASIQSAIAEGVGVDPSRAEANEGSSISCPIDLIVNASGTKTSTSEGASLLGLCVVCLDARVEAACVPCGHMAGCMSCLLEIKAKKSGCPACRANIYQVIKLYVV